METLNIALRGCMRNFSRAMGNKLVIHRSGEIFHNFQEHVHVITINSVFLSEMHFMFSFIAIYGLQ